MNTQSNIWKCFIPEAVLSQISIHQRIKQLIHYIPEIEGIFVQKNGNEYYLIFELEKANDFEEDGDEIRLNDKLIDSFSQTEIKLHKMVLSRLSGLKSMIKSGFPKQSFANHSELTSEDDQLTEIAAQIVKIHPIEEIYLFHQVQTNQQTTYFFLLIGEGLGTEILNRIQQSVNSTFEGKYSVILIGHSRSWIQTNLFYQQSFFKKIMKSENLRFQSHPNHPSIHWKTPSLRSIPTLNIFTVQLLGSQHSILFCGTIRRKTIQKALSICLANRF